MARRKTAHWEHWIEPEAPPEPEKADDYVDAREPDPWTLLVPVLPVILTPHSKCPHHGPFPPGSPFVCLICFQSGKDGTRAIPADVAPLPKDPKPIEDEPEKPLTRKERRKLEKQAEHEYARRRAMAS
jgi:hypothetical protein